MSELVEAAATPVRIKRDDKEYLVSPMTIGDSAELQRWAEERYWQDMQERLARTKDPDVQKLIRHRMATISRAELRTEMSDYINSSESDEQYLWLMLRHEHSDITIEEARKLVSRSEFNDIFIKLHPKLVDKITALEQRLFAKILPELLKKLDDPEDKDIVHPVDFIQQIRNFWTEYQKELESIRPPADA